MNFLEERILKDGVVKEGNVLKVDSFLNHQMDVELIDKIGEEFHRRFKDKKITKVLTIEASGIAMAYAVARCFGVPMVFAKKAKSINIDGDMYTAEVESFTHKNKNQVIVSKKFLSADDKLLIVDDFLANGCALQGLISIAEAAGASSARAEAMFSNPEFLKKKLAQITPEEAQTLLNSVDKEKSEEIMKLLRERGADVGR
jgi:xanthine phosphoribosyltransferase